MMLSFWRPLAAGLVLLAALLADLAWAGADGAGHEAGRKIYNFRCYYCHGYSGDAKTLAATYLTPRPTSFASLRPGDRSRQAMLKSVRDGHPGTAMKGFRSILNSKEIESVVNFVREEFMARKAVNTRYHIPENGWADHARHKDAFPFATGELPLDTPWETLTPAQARGKRLFLSTCVSCHDRSRVLESGPAWESRAVSYPRNQYTPGGRPPVDATTSASPYLKHDRAPKIAGLSNRERQGERLYQDNCAFCHAADGTGMNWIGSFMEPHPRNLTDPAFMKNMTRQRLAETIRDGLPETSMPAWGSVFRPTEIDAIVSYVSRAFHPLPK